MDNVIRRRGPAKIPAFFERVVTSILLANQSSHRCLIFTFTILAAVGVALPLAREHLGSPPFSEDPRRSGSIPDPSPQYSTCGNAHPRTRLFDGNKTRWPCGRRWQHGFRIPRPPRPAFETSLPRRNFASAA